MEKTDKFKKVAEAVLHLLDVEGIPGLSFTRVAKLSGVSRPWLYKYVGKRPLDLLEFAADDFGREILKVGGAIPSTGSPQEFIRHAVASTWLLMGAYADRPESLSLYFRHCGKATPLGSKIRGLEETRLAQLSQAIGKATKVSKSEALLMAEVMLAIRMGLSFRFSRSWKAKRYTQKEIQTAMRRVFEYSVPILK